jgi:hypothetical protein
VQLSFIGKTPPLHAPLPLSGGECHVQKLKGWVLAPLPPLLLLLLIFMLKKVLLPLLPLLLLPLLLLLLLLPAPTCLP